MQLKIIKYLTTFAMLLAFLVVLLGAFTRLTDAGLGCPDWPGCYGQLVLPQNHNDLRVAQANYPQMPIETHKAWTEMLHRYLAGLLGVFIVLTSIACFWSYFQGQIVTWRLPALLIFLVLFQATLGMWTVTLKLLPIIVLGHLLGGVFIFCCLNGLQLQLNQSLSLSQKEQKEAKKWRSWIILGFLIVFLQIVLGGWVSSNYAGIACIGFPQCNHQWLPSLYFSQAFNLLSPLGANYQGGILDNAVRITIQFTHRLGAILTLLYVLGITSILLLKIKDSYLRRLTQTAFSLILIQFSLGVINVIYLLPLWVSIAHNGVAALLLATMFKMALYLSLPNHKRISYEC